MLPWQRSGTGDSAFRRGTTSRRRTRVRALRVEALHQPVGVRAEREGLVRVAEGAGPLRDELGSLLAPVPHRAGTEAVEGGEQIDDEFRPR